MSKEFEVKEAKRFLLVVGFVAVAFFLFGLKVQFTESVNKAAYDCTNFKMFSHDEIDFACYRLTGLKESSRD